MKIEEDIEVLKNINKLVKIEFKHNVTDRELQGIENLIQVYKEQEEKIKLQQEELEKKDKMIDEYIETLSNKQSKIDTLETIAGLALRVRPLKISKETFAKLYNTIEIEQTEDFTDDSYIFIAR